jgi:hypothetical protein
MIMNYILDHVPWWMWVVGGMVVVGGLFAFFAPVLMPLWAMVPKPVKVALGGIIAVGVAFLAGRNRGTSDEQQREKERDAEAVHHREDVNKEVANLDDAAVDKRIDKWMRD